MGKTRITNWLTEVLLWSFRFLASIAVVFSMLFWAMERSLPVLDAIRWAISAHFHDPW